ncbi:hypothetical protein EMCRGX_G014742 [Ephydatia muelleri]
MEIIARVRVSSQEGSMAAKSYIRASFTFSIAGLFLALVASKAKADCNYTNTSNANGNITYKLACTEACTYWKFYILEYPVPLTGVCSTLPCLFNSIGVSTSTTALRNQMGMKSSTQPACWIAFNATTAGNLLILAQSFYSPTMHIGDVMIRFDPSQSPPRPSSTLIAKAVTMQDSQLLFTASQNLSATQTPDAGKEGR